MRLGLTLGILGLTALLFFTAIQSNARRTDAQFEALSTQLVADQESLAKDAEDQISGLQSQLSALHNERQSLDAELARVSAEASKLKTLEIENTTLSQSVVDLQSELQSYEAIEAENEKLTSESLAMSALVADMEADLAALRAGELGMNDLIAERDAMSQELRAAGAKLAEMGDIVSRNDQLAADNGALSEEIGALQSELSGVQQATVDANTTVDELNEMIVTFQEENRALTVNLAELESAMEASSKQGSYAEEELKLELAALLLAADEKAAALLVADESIDALSQEVAALARVEDELIETEERVATLLADIAVRDLAISELRTQVQSPSASPLTPCQEKSEAALVGGGILFQPGTTSLAPSAIQQLENISAIAAECAQLDLVLEIEGHTDSEGGDASNLLLSNGRAMAVYDFLAERGVPPTAMRAVGFGKSDPTADSATSDGRAKNERIVFDWEPS